MSNDKFEEQWKSHVDDLTRLGWNLNADDFERVKELQEELRGLVEKAAENNRRVENE